MDVLIRGIDEEVYARLKARASERGLKNRGSLNRSHQDLAKKFTREK